MPEWLPWLILLGCLGFFLSSTEKYTPPSWKYTVFLSFRGADTRRRSKCFINRLYDRLHNISKIKTFKDDTALVPGTVISVGLLRAIEDSRFAVVVFSKNFANSEWCLDELNHIILCMASEDGILPVFYKVAPSYVREQEGEFGKAFDKLVKKYGDKSPKVIKWRDSLSKVSIVGGFVCREEPGWRSAKKFDAKLIDKIVKGVLLRAGGRTHSPYGMRICRIGRHGAPRDPRANLK